ncbi:MAG: DUF4143 domain-containing protein [Streptococcaceae bacterium]|jgi:predicted AAA+ superfamily ATPase|nr:DUF4143 domain-containing protein [Streptococcaceae bacterium]
MYQKRLIDRLLDEEFNELPAILIEGAKAVGKTDFDIMDYLDELFRSGFPGIRRYSQKAIKRQLEGYVENIIQREFEENGFTIRKPESLRAWMKAYAAASATTTTDSKILEVSISNFTEQTSRQTATSYKNALNTLNIIHDVPAWLPMGKLFPNLAKTSKHFLLDASLIPTLLNITKEELTQYQVPKPISKFNKTFLGQLFEALVYQSLIVYVDILGAQLSHFRTKDGKREIDFILQKGKTVVAFEVKASQNASDDYVENINWFQQSLGDEYQVTKILINSGPRAYLRVDGVYVVPLALLGL